MCGRSLPQGDATVGKVPAGFERQLFHWFHGRNPVSATAIRWLYNATGRLRSSGALQIRLQQLSPPRGSVSVTSHFSTDIEFAITRNIAKRDGRGQFAVAVNLRTALAVWRGRIKMSVDQALGIP